MVLLLLRLLLVCFISLFLGYLLFLYLFIIYLFIYFILLFSDYYFLRLFFLRLFFLRLFFFIIIKFESKNPAKIEPSCEKKFIYFFSME